MSPVQRRTTGFGPGNVIEKWLNAYGEGDANRPMDLDEWRKGTYGWLQTAPPAGKYLAHVKSLAEHWPHLQLLVDFMDAGTTPVRWNSGVPGGYPDDPGKRDAQRTERMARTRVSVLEYPREPGAHVEGQDFTVSTDLRDYLTGLEKQDSSNIVLRLFAVEDLSRDVIELLGGHYDVNPSFFREHLVDYVWYNIKDWWREAPNLDIVSRSQNWFQMRFSRSRYFKNQGAFETAEAEARKFNVYRLLSGDFNHSKFWDSNKDSHGTKEAKVGHLRSRATFWMKTPKPAATEDGRTIHEPTVGILLLDPTLTEGNPLWMQYRNWSRVPTMQEKTADKNPLPEDSGPPQKSFFDDFLYWAKHPSAFSFDPDIPPHHLRDSSSPVCIPTQALLHMVGNEWLTLAEYIKTRLNQVDWEIAFPGNFLAKDEQIEKALGKLHYWRRVVPVYRAMLAETFLRVFREAKHPDRMHVGTTLADRALEHDVDVGASATAWGGGFGSGGGGGSRGPGSALDKLLDRECINAYQQDYTLILNYLEEYQSRIDRLTEVVTAVISIQDSRRGYKDNKNLQWLTWLATFFIPLSFVATMLSMTTGPLDELRGAAVMWAEVSVPSGLVVMCVVLAMSFAKSRRSIRAFMGRFPWLGGGGAGGGRP